MSADCLAEIQGTTKDLLEFEKVIEKGLQTFAEVGSALIAIRERRLYLLSHRTFEDYLLDRWELKQSRAYQLMDAAATIGNLKQSSTIVELPQNESQCRPLSQLPLEQQAEAWQEALETAPNGKATSTHVQQAVDKRKPSPDGHTFEEVQAMYAPYGTFKPTGDRRYRYSFDCVGIYQRFTGLDEAYNNFEWMLQRIETTQKMYGKPEPEREVYGRLTRESVERIKAERLDNAEAVQPESEPVEQSATYKTKRDRIANDYYPTPDEIINILLERVKIKGTVLEPCAGHGAIAKFFPDCITNEPFPTDDFAPDFANDATDPVFWESLNGRFDWVVTNPPYEGQAMRTILEAALVHAKVGVAMLIRLSYLEPCQDRVKLLQDYSNRMTHQITVSPRPQFRKDTNSSDNITSAWIVWRKDWNWSERGIDCPFQFVAGWR